MLQFIKALTTQTCSSGLPSLQTSSLYKLPGLKHFVMAPENEQKYPPPHIHPGFHRLSLLSHNLNVTNIYKTCPFCFKPTKAPTPFVLSLSRPRKDTKATDLYSELAFASVQWYHPARPLAHILRLLVSLRRKGLLVLSNESSRLSASSNSAPFDSLLSHRVRGVVLTLLGRGQYSSFAASGHSHKAQKSYI